MTISRTVVPELPFLSVALTARMHVLLERNTEGTLSAIEHEELEMLVEGAQLAQSLAMADQAVLVAGDTSHDERLVVGLRGAGVRCGASMDGHRQAMELVEEAERLARDGLVEAARERYQEAAKLEEGCADAAPETQPRTRGVLRVSAVSAWKLARVPEHAEALARRYLAEPIAPGFARELHELLNELQRERYPRLPREAEEGGRYAGRGWIAEDFDDALPPEIQKYFEGEDSEDDTR